MQIENLFEGAANFKHWTTTNRAAWGSGEWDDEPDKIQWIDPATGLDCLMHRTPTGGHWCGYVGVAPGHPWHGKDYDAAIGECSKEDCWHYDHSPGGLTEVHGGLTFASACADTKDESRGICHVAAEGRPPHVWWFGFDCAHSGDLSPGHKFSVMSDGYERYRDVAYVKGEVEKLAKQIAAVAA